MHRVSGRHGVQRLFQGGAVFSVADKHSFCDMLHCAITFCLQDNQPHGSGMLVTSSGVSFHGLWENGKIGGFGTLTLPSGKCVLKLLAEVACELLASIVMSCFCSDSIVASVAPPHHHGRSQVAFQWLA